MEPKAKENIHAIRQHPKLKSLLKKYRQLKTMQSGLLQLSELASSVTDMDAFYHALESVIKTLLVTDSFHIALLNNSDELQLAYCHNPVEMRLREHVDLANWRKSLTGLVLLRQQPMHCSAKVRNDLAKTDEIVMYGSVCVDWLGVPLKRGKQIIGVIALQSYDDKLYFSERDCQILEFIAEHLMTAIDRVRSRELLESSIRQRTLKLTQTNQQLQREIVERQLAVKTHRVLLNISELTAKSQAVENFYQALHHEINKLLLAKNFYIALLSDDKTQLEFPYHCDEKLPQPETRKLSNGLSELAIREAKPVLLSARMVYTLSAQGEVTQSAFTQYYPERELPKSWLAAPLSDQGEVFGVIAIQHYQDEAAYHSKDLELMRFVSHHISIEILRQRAQQRALQSHEALEKMINKRTQELQATNLNLRMQIEERRKAEARLYHDAHHDALTQLPNRAMFADRLTYSIRHLKRYPKQRFAVLFIDLDRFKMINDTLGHHAGDQFLIEISQRLRACVRDNDILARLGGDEFVVLLDSLQSLEDVEEIASRIIDSIAQPFELDGHTLYSNASIGIAQSRMSYKDANEILRDADAAMYQAKSLGRGRYVFFDDSMREQLIASMTLEQELRQAIQSKQFELHYQKISDLSSTKALGFEVLLRWQHPTKGLLTPSEFLFMAEETGMILEIETWVIEEVCLQLKLWKQSKEYEHTYIGVNLSGRHLTQANQLAKLINLIRGNTLEPERLILEFNESAFTRHTELALKGLRKLKKLGVKLALDDYGAGLSSFNFLHHYPFEFIKLDRSFVRSLNHNEKNLSLVKALHELGTNFGYRLVAEGIESEAMLKKLQHVGCEFGQGYHISRPAKIVRAKIEDNVIEMYRA
ncbi:EAL domain-containing protein [Colwellia sp. M166]|uniref:bifunctional diguanylate cyclase/phosphodiesterase n=1 Tax=Colwellia sp. M166 TaxID=2583805 RepID=UPI00211F2986|nr:EAL domain-containing protein [Colwellia sp. M166]UUO23686.1 EAL domain-containing protein [Colwellia sp. M166]|tara:strand:- start:97351 stop:99969 length:2619 start_codon:yes stop_codon:yes gene_type:complete